GLPFPSLLPSRSSGGYPDPWGTSSPVGTPIHTHTLTHNSLHDPLKWKTSKRGQPPGSSKKRRDEDEEADRSRVGASW
ncbi:hypothetical protein, partial [Thermus scotoductus]|uniref:hypothetical protein n=1 Tax=Thermus scotoductus TaxID=37636 RepID=UPI001C12C1D2